MDVSPEDDLLLLFFFEIEGLYGGIQQNSSRG